LSNETLHIDDLLSNSFAGFEPAMPAFVWDNIANELDKKTQKRGFVWWKVAAIALVLAGLGYGIRQFQNQSNNAKVSKSDKSDQSAHKQSQNSGDKSSASHTSGISPQSNQGKNNSAVIASPANSEAKLNKGTHVQNPLHDAPQPTNLTPAPINPMPAQTYQEIVLAENGMEGIKLVEIEDPSWSQFLQNEAKEILSAKTLTPPVRPLVNLGSHFMLGLGVGQAISNTGYSVNNQYSRYVNPMFKKEITQGEGILASLCVNAALYYKINKESKVSFYSGLSYYQRKNSLNFNFGRYTPDFDGLLPRDKQGKLAFIENYKPAGKPFDTINFKGTNTFTQIEIPLGICANFDFGHKKAWSFIPSFSTNIGFITEKVGKTLDYSELNVVKIDPTWYRTTYFSLNASAGIYKTINTNVKIGLNMGAGYMLTPMYVPGSTIRPRALTGGLSTQLIWRID
jgi:hypothetical protein